MRPSAETTPTVTVFCRPNGLPMAITVSPIIRSSERPNGTVGHGPGPLSLRTARSLALSAPTTVASTWRLSARVTVILLAAAMTWSFVST